MKDEIEYFAGLPPDQQPEGIHPDYARKPKTGKEITERMIMRAFSELCVFPGKDSLSREVILRWLDRED